MASDDTSEKKPKRAPRKRASSVRTKTTKTRASTRVSIKTTAHGSLTRKAPTPIAATKAASKAKQKQYFFLGLFLLIGIGVSAAVGITDEGQIDVNKTIEARNERIRTGQGGQDGDGSQSVVIPVQNTNRQADGGLRGLGVGSANRQAVPQPETSTSSATSTATSTEASSTDESVTESTEEENTETSEPTGESVIEEDVAAEPEVEGVSTSTVSGSGR